jgi:hypothetical protein
VRPPSQGERVGGQAFRLVEAALQQCLAGPEERGVPAEVELAQLPGSSIVELQVTLEVGQVALFELVGHEEPAASEGHHLVAAGLGELDDLGGDGQPFLQVVRPQVAMWWSYRTAARVAGSPSRLDMATAARLS